ncbi:helix-turn-helix domain-containing protein [Staphylococcus arlettae]|uniref:helix-turn-helix domain-containing protein n=1 Tax=Staphylococcus arlettae TaxID=29378 RepID=UPI0021D1F69E|nr:helix-turn-helix transcriptional regulator [Staphylococcus arlettae]UXU49811.1 helix-turn-helix transcriptional regulator [Staphylococcus arlettae]
MIICTLNKLMEVNDKTQSEVASKTGITRPTLLSLIRNDNQSIRYETINQLCKFFDVDMSELLVYSPVEVKLKNVLLEDVPMTTDFEVTEENSSVAVSLIYDINGIELEFDTNLSVTKTSNSLKNSGKFFFNSLIYEDELNALESKGFKHNFVKIYNNSIDLESVIKEKLSEANLDTNFRIKHYEVGIQGMKRTDKTFVSLAEELKSLVDVMPFEDKEKEKMYKKINEIKQEVNNNNNN